MNSQISDYDALEAVKEIREHLPEVNVAMIGRPGAGPNPLDILKTGARACLARSISAADLIKSIELISSGRIIISPVFAEKFLSQIASAEKADENRYPRASPWYFIVQASLALNPGFPAIVYTSLLCLHLHQWLSQNIRLTTQHSLSNKAFSAMETSFLFD